MWGFMPILILMKGGGSYVRYYRRYISDVVNNQYDGKSCLQDFLRHKNNRPRTAVIEII
jgi:hypothetical protein